MNGLNPYRMRIFIERDRMFGDTFAVRMAAPHKDDDKIYVAKPIEYEIKEDRGIETPPALVLRKDDAQAFMDELWHAGIRPTEGTGSAGSLAATQQHLKDMRTLVSKAHGVELK